MKLSVNIPDLKKALARVAPVASKKHIVPQYEYVYFTVGEDHVYLTTSDGAMAIDVLLSGASISEAGFVAVSASKLNAVVQTLSEGKLSISVQNSQLLLKAPRFRCLLDCMEPVSINTMRNGFKVISKLNVKSDVLKRGLKSVIEAVGSPKESVLYQGVLFESSVDCPELVLSASDTRFILQTDIEVVMPVDMKAIVPTKFLRTAIQVLPDDTMLTISYGGNRLTIDNEEVNICSILIEGDALPVSRVLASRAQCDKQATVNREELINAVKQASVLIDDEFPFVLCKFDKNVLSVESSQHNPNNRSEAIRSIPCSYTQEPVAFRLMVRYLVNALEATDSEEICLHLKEKMPVFICGNPEANWRGMIAISHGPRTSE